MPRKDGTGPMGAGSMTGRGLGFCSTTIGQYGEGVGFGRACRHGQGYGFGRDYTSCRVDSKQQKDMLLKQKAYMQKRLDVIEKQLETL